MQARLKIGEYPALDHDAGLRFEYVDRGDAVASIKGFAVRYSGQVYAYENRCPHMGIELDWAPGVFFDKDSRYLVCSTHGARFEPETGLCVAGPCTGQSLTPLAVVEDEGAFYLELENA